jgi:hypothetical protein
LTATRAVVAENHEVGAVTSGRGSTMELTDTVVRATRPRADGTHGEGLNAQGGARLTATRVAVSATVNAGVLVLGAGTTAEFTDGVVRATVARADGAFGRGLEALDGARLAATRVLVAGCREIGVNAQGANTAVTLRDAIVRGTASDARGGHGHGIAALEGARVDAARVLVEDNHESAVVARGAGATVALADAVVRATRAGAAAQYGIGLAAFVGGRIAARRTLVSENNVIGAWAEGDGSALELTDVAVRETTPDRNGFFGRAVTVQAAAALAATRVLVTATTELGVTVIQPGATATLTDVLITDITPSARGFGAGAMAFGGARVTVERLAVARVRGAALAAAPFDHPTDGTLADAELSGRDVFVRNVQSSALRWNEPGALAAPPARLVAYGLHAGDGCALDLTRAVVADGGYGFFAAAGARLAMRTGVITGQLSAAGASNTGPDALVLDDVSVYRNASNAVLSAVELPSAAALPSPSPPPCLEATCP